MNEYISRVRDNNSPNRECVHTSISLCAEQAKARTRTRGRNSPITIGVHDDVWGCGQTNTHAVIAAKCLSVLSATLGESQCFEQFCR